MAEHLRAGTNVVVLGKHGLVVAADSLVEAKRLRGEVSKSRISSISFWSINMACCTMAAYPGAVDGLAELESRGRKIVVVTNSYCKGL